MPDYSFDELVVTDAEASTLEHDDVLERLYQACRMRVHYQGRAAVLREMISRYTKRGVLREGESDE